VSVLDRGPTDTVRVLDETGRPVGPVPDADEATLVGIYRAMRKARRFDERAVSLQRQGRMGTYPPLAGQEAAQVASSYALAERDWVLPTYREHAATMVRGMPLERTLLYWMGHPRGGTVPEDVNVFPITVPIASQIPHAVGAAWARKLQGGREVVLCHFGDGATSEGDFHEGLTFAGVFDTPTVFLCNNNQWAISVPRERQTAAETLAMKADGYGVEGVRVDGMDPLAVLRVVRAAAEKARDPPADRARPTLIEAEMYRFGAHTTADDPTVYRDEAEVERWREKDPLKRFESYLREERLLDDDRIAEIESAVDAEITDAVEAAESTPRPEPSALFEHVHGAATPRVAAGRDRLAALRERYGDAAFTGK